MKILVAKDSPEVDRAVASLTRRGWMKLLVGNREAPQHNLTYYYPYYFQSWRVTVPKTLGRTVKVQIVTGVNGMSRSTGPADGWPAEEEVELSETEVIRPCTPEVEGERFALIYVPYYVYAREGQPIRKAALVEGLTGTVGKVIDVPEIFEVVTPGKLGTTIGGKGWFR